MDKWAVARRVWGLELVNLVIRLSACMKVRHVTRSDARRQIRHLRTKRHHEARVQSRTLNEYFCTRCGYWHVGHNSLMEIQ